MITKILPLRLIADKTNLDFMGKRKITFFFSAAFLVISILIVILKGFNLGIDFSGGILIEAKFKKEQNLAILREELSNLAIGDVALQSIDGENDIMIRVGVNKSSQEQQIKSINTIKELLTAKSDGGIEYKKIDFVGPQVGKELIINGITALLLSFVGIMVYMWFRFEWQYGVGVILALLHDVIFTLGFVSVSHIEFNLTSIAAILTIIGYSVNDSVVIYDRIRENIRKYKKMELNELINLSINETLSRTILTVLTTLLACLALIIYGGEVIYSFSMTTFVGIVIGTYSSIFISAPILVYLNIRKIK